MIRKFIFDRLNLSTHLKKSITVGNVIFPSMFLYIYFVFSSFSCVIYKDIVDCAAANIHQHITDVSR